MSQNNYKLPETPLTQQEIFDKVWDLAVVKRTPPSLSQDPSGETGVCTFRASLKAADPVRCFVGALIPDELYVPEMEKASSLDLLCRSFPQLNACFGLTAEKNRLAFLEELQKLHDDAAMSSNLETYHVQVEHRLRGFALRKNLKLPRT
jgi:hypothetical protein